MFRKYKNKKQNKNVCSGARQHYWLLHCPVCRGGEEVRLFIRHCNITYIFQSLVLLQSLSRGCEGRDGDTKVQMQAL